MAIGQKTVKIQDTKHERTEGTTDIMFVSESVLAKLQNKPGGKDRYKVIGEVDRKSGEPVKKFAGGSAGDK